MNIKLIHIVLVISLFINGVVLGVLGYRYFFAGAQETITVPETEKQVSELPPRALRGQRLFYNQVRDQRQQIQELQNTVLDLLMEDTLDYDKIDAALENINRLRAEVYHLIAYQIIDDLKTLSAEEKEMYIENLRKRLQRRHHRHSERRSNTN